MHVPKSELNFLSIYFVRGILSYWNSTATTIAYKQHKHFLNSTDASFLTSHDAFHKRSVFWRRCLSRLYIAAYTKQLEQVNKYQ